MLIMRLVFIALALFLVGFGIYPALEYSNAGALLMLVLAAFFIILAIFLRPLLALRRTIFGKLIAVVFALAGAYFIAVNALIFVNGRPVDPMPKADAVIVPGAGLTYGTDEPSLALSYRLDKALDYLKEYPDTPIIVSGGQGEFETTSEAHAMKKYLVDAGVSSSQIYLEDSSTRTAENLSHSAEILEQHDWDTAAIITSDYHCFRAGILAERAGISATCIPADNVWWLAPADQSREFLAFTKALVSDIL